MSDFAKLFATENAGQILVLIQEGDSGPEIRVFTRPAGLGVCSFAIEFTDDDEGWDKAEEAFEVIGAEEAQSLVGKVFGSLEREVMG